MKRGIALILVGLLLTISSISWAKNLPIKAKKSIEPIIFNRSYDEIWKAVVLISICYLDWRIEIKDKDVGVIKFIRSYIFTTDLEDKKIRRIYEWPTKSQIGSLSDVSDYYLPKYVYFTEHEKSIFIFPFIQEDLLILVSPINGNSTQVKIRYIPRPWQDGFWEDCQSNGMMEYEIVEAIKAYLKENS